MGAGESRGCFGFLGGKKKADECENPKRPEDVISCDVAEDVDAVAAGVQKLAVGDEKPKVQESPAVKTKAKDALERQPPAKKPCTHNVPSDMKGSTDAPKVDKVDSNITPAEKFITNLRFLTQKYC